MAVESDPDVLDLLFDKSDGILKSDLPDIQTIDFVSKLFFRMLHKHRVIAKCESVLIKHFKYYTSIYHLNISISCRWRK
jgi:hypothetical protein